VPSEPELRRLHAAVFSHARTYARGRARAAWGVGAWRVRLRLALRSACCCAVAGLVGASRGHGFHDVPRMGPECSALLVVSDGLSNSLWQQAVVGFGHQAPLGRLYLFFEARLAAMYSTTPLTLTPRHAQVGGEASDRQLVRLATRCFQCIANEVRLVGTASLSATAHVSHSGAAARPGAPLSGRWLDAGGGFAAE